jgi:hypothetical protein
MFEVVEGLDVDSELVAGLKRTLLAGQARPSAAMRRFERVLGWFELKHNGLVHPFVDVFLLWDIHCVLRLEAWQESAGKKARAWFAAFGELEALSAFASLAFDEPLFSFPEIVEDAVRFERALATRSSARVRVPNDVALHALLTVRTCPARARLCAPREWCCHGAG